VVKTPPDSSASRQAIVAIGLPLARFVHCDSEPEGLVRTVASCRRSAGAPRQVGPARQAPMSADRDG